MTPGAAAAAWWPDHRCSRCFFINQGWIDEEIFNSGQVTDEMR